MTAIQSKEEVKEEIKEDIKVESRVDISDAPEKKKKNIMDRALRKQLPDSERPTTDKHWFLLFVVVFTVCFTSIFYTRFLMYTVFSSGMTNGTNFYLWGKFATFDAMTFNLEFLDAYYQQSGLIVIYANAIISVCLIMYSLKKMHFNGLFGNERSIIILALIILSAVHRTGQIRTALNDYEYDSDSICEDGTLSCTFMNGCKAFGLIPYHKKLWIHVMPELILLLVCYTKHVSNKRNPGRKSDIYHYKECFFCPVHMGLMLSAGLMCIYYVSGIPMVLGILFETYKWNGGGLWFYVIAGTIIYLHLVVFYFHAIVMASITDIQMDYKKGKPDNMDILGLMFTVPKRLFRHFGTACYHATLIFPRLKTFCVMNEPEFREKLNFGKRFYVSQFLMHDITLAATAVNGTNHEESLRQLLRVYINYNETTIKWNRFQSHSQYIKSLWAFLLGTNNFMLILFWLQGNNNPELSTATWIFYLRLIITLNFIVMKISDVVMNTILIHLESALYHKIKHPHALHKHEEY